MGKSPSARLGLLVALFVLVCSPWVEAAQSIRVLLSADVLKLEVQADGPVWITDSSRHGRALRPVIRIVPSGKGFSVNGLRMAREQLTMRAGEQGLGMVRRQIGAQRNHDAALGRVDHDRVGLVEIGRERLG